MLYEVITVLTADTYGTLQKEFESLPVTIEKITNELEKVNAAVKYSPYIGRNNFV